MPAGPHPADSLNHFQPDLGIPYDSISSGSALADVRIHDLRHSFASALVNEGMTLYDVKEFVNGGHKLYQMAA